MVKFIFNPEPKRADMPDVNDILDAYDYAIEKKKPECEYCKG